MFIWGLEVRFGCVCFISLLVYFLNRFFERVFSIILVYGSDRRRRRLRSEGRKVRVVRGSIVGFS